jgi:hypothetical protein
MRRRVVREGSRPSWWLPRQWTPYEVLTDRYLPLPRRGVGLAAIIFLNAEILDDYLMKAIVLSPSPVSRAAGVSGGIGPAPIFFRSRMLLTRRHRPQLQSRFLAATGGIGPAARFFCDRVEIHSPLLTHPHRPFTGVPFPHPGGWESETLNFLGRCRHALCADCYFPR